MRKTILSLCFVFLHLVSVLSALPASPAAQPDSVAEKIAGLQNRLNEIEKQAAEKAKQEELQALMDRARAMSQEHREEPEIKKFHSGLRQQSALNPNISVGGEFYTAWGKSESELNRSRSETEWGTGQLTLREVELGIESALDPYSRGKVFIGIGPDEAAVEEAYVTWLNCPLNMNLKAGKFKAQFGQLNRYHDHALPQFDRPRMLVRYFGNETLHGTGISGNFLLPSLWAHVNELDLEIFTGGNGYSFTDEGRHNLISSFHLKNYYDLNRSTYLEIGLSGAAGNNDPEEKDESLIFGTDVTVKWQPPGHAKYSGIEWKTECLISNRHLGAGRVKTWGAFSTVQVRTGARTMVSGRLDYSQLPVDSALRERGGALAFDYWQSEFVFIRFQYTVIDRNFDDSDQRFIIHTCWAMGPHRHEVY
ncbi:hypothetical protein JW948_18135 [bacterium]|nr:hypothetical protein [bacterium]